MIEKIIQENTAALKALAAAIGEAGTASAETPDKPLRKPAQKKAAAKKEPAAGKTRISIKDISNLVISVADSINRETAISILAEFGVKRVNKVPPAKFALLAKRLKTALADAQSALDDGDDIGDDDDLGSSNDDDDLTDFDDDFDGDDLL